VPESWGEEFCALLPKLTEQARFKNEVPELF
jgi:hypothetical protein